MEEERPTETAESDTDETPSIAVDSDVDQPAEDQVEVDEDPTATVSNLEQEMARLLGEITAKRDS